MRFERDDAKIGLLVLIAVAVFGAILFHRSLSAIVKKENIVKLRLKDVSDLDVGTSVQLQGYRIGQVNEIMIEQKDAEYSFIATLGLLPEIRLSNGTRAVISAKGLGGVFVDLQLPPPEMRQQLLAPDAILEGETGASLGTLIEEIQGFVQNLNGSLNELKLHLREKGLGAILDHPDVHKALVDLDGALLSFKKVGLSGDALVQQGQGSVKSLDRTLASLEKSSAVLQSLLEKRSGDIDAIILNLSSLLKDLQGLSTEMNAVVKGSGPKLEDSLKTLDRDLKAAEELLEILKNKPSRVILGTPSEAEKKAARERVEVNRKKDEAPKDSPETPVIPPPVTAP